MSKSWVYETEPFVPPAQSCIPVAWAELNAYSSYPTDLCKLDMYAILTRSFILNNHLEPQMKKSEYHVGV